MGVGERRIGKDPANGGRRAEYSILDVRVGSIIVQVITASVFALAIAKAARATIGCLIQAAVMVVAGSAMVKQLKKAGSPEDVKRCLSTIGIDFSEATSFEAISTALQNVSAIGVKLGQTQESGGN